MVRVDDLEFNGIAYVTVDKSGTWVWEVKPELKEVEGKLGWYLPEKYQGPGMTMLMEQTKGSVLPILLNGKDKEFNDTLKVFDKPRIFKIVLEEVSYCKDDKENDSLEMIEPIHKDSLKPFREHISPARCEMFQAHVEMCDNFMMSGLNQDPQGSNGVNK